MVVVFVVGVDLRELNGEAGVSQVWYLPALLDRCFVFPEKKTPIGLTLSYRPDILPVDDVSSTDEEQMKAKWLVG